MRERRPANITALEYYIRQGWEWPYLRSSPRFPQIPNHDSIFPLSDDERAQRLEAFALDLQVTVQQVVTIIGQSIQTTGLMFDELLYQHEFSGWSGDYLREVENAEEQEEETLSGIECESTETFYQTAESHAAALMSKLAD